MKKFLALVTAVLMMASAAACDKRGQESQGAVRETETQKIDINELHSLEGHMLEVTATVSDPYYVGTSTVTYSGDVSVPNPVNDYWLTMSDEDYLFIYNFCIDAYENNTYAGASEPESVMDGTNYRFVYYDADGNAHELYNGPITNNETLTAVVETIGNYSVD